MRSQFKIVIGLVAVAAIVGLVYVNLIKWHDMHVEKAVEDERKKWERKTANLKQVVTALEQDLTDTEKNAISEKKVAEALGPLTAGKDTLDKPVALQDIERQILSFFKYLDRQPYVASRMLDGGTYRVYRETADLLGRNSPVLTGETENLYRLSKNMAHFYRVLGKEYVHLAADVLENEAEILEPAMNTFYTWYTFEDPAGSTLKGRPSQQVQYQYAAFFLDTLAGRSYLLRRDSKIRILTIYFCIRILDLANDAQINSLGIDIRPHIRNAYRDIQDRRRLLYRRAYLKELDRLARKYEMAGGS